MKKPVENSSSMHSFITNFRSIERFSFDGFGKCSLFVLSKNIDSLFSLMHVETALFDWPIVFKYDVKAKYRLISGKFSGMKFFPPSIRLTNQKPRVFVSFRQTNQIALFPFVCCFCFVRVFSFQGHMKIALKRL